MVTETTPPDSSPQRTAPARLTGRERRRRIILLVVLVVLLALLAYATYYFTQNRRLPGLRLAEPASVVEPPRFLYAITGAGTNKLLSPVGVGVAADGRVYAVDFGRRRVSVFTNDGRFLFSFNKTDDGVLSNPVHLAVKDGEVWVTDRRHSAIFIYDLQGKFQRRFEPQNEELEWAPLALAFSDKGELRVTDVNQSAKHRLHYFSAEGSRTATVGRTVQVTSLDEAPGGFYFPNGVAVSKDGSVFVSDGNNRRVQVFDEKGEFKEMLDTSGVPRGMAIDEKEQLYVVDAVAHTVDIYTLGGNQLTQFGSQGFGPGQFNFPNDIALDGRGRIYVSDRSNGQVQVWGWPVAEPPAVAAPTSVAGWLACLAPLLLLPLLLLLRKIRIVVTPDFVEAIVVAEQVQAVARKRRLRLVAPEVDRALYEGRTEEGLDLSTIVEFETHSESDSRAIVDKIAVPERDAVYLSMAMRARALGTSDREMRRNAVLADVRVVSFEDFMRDYLDAEHS